MWLATLKVLGVCNSLNVKRERKSLTVLDSFYIFSTLTVYLL